VVWGTVSDLRRAVAHPALRLAGKPLGRIRLIRLWSWRIQVAQGSRLLLIVPTSGDHDVRTSAGLSSIRFARLLYSIRPRSARPPPRSRQPI
jgi:hypothetical protein